MHACLATGTGWSDPVQRLRFSVSIVGSTRFTAPDIDCLRLGVRRSDLVIALGSRRSDQRSYLLCDGGDGVAMVW